MNPEVKEKWVAALRSGDYPQGKFKLQTPDGFCCLGVLCDLAVQEGVIDYPSYRKGVWYYSEDYCAFLPPAVMKWSGISSERGKTPNGWTLSERNDSGVSFETIADMIDASY